ncbi:MAG: multidrug resistance efflux transporter family protein [Oscillospiraceae bacterium]
MRKAIFKGLLASMFFAATFVLNRSMNLGGGNYLWSACLRYIFMLPILYILLMKNKGANKVHSKIKEDKMGWFLWSTVGFGLFYLPLSYASNSGEAWLVVGTWQITIIAGALLTPLWGKKIPYKMIFVSITIIVGVFILQLEGAKGSQAVSPLSCILPVLVAAFCYPLGNRKMMDVSKGELSTTQRVYGMTLCSMPFWIIVAVFAYIQVGLPSVGQVLQALAVAVFSGVVATILFFRATDMVKDNPRQLAAVEATQAGEVVFTLIGGLLFLGEKLPGPVGIFGLFLILSGMMINSFVLEK